MEDGRMLDAHIFNGCITNIVVSWIFEIFLSFALFYAYLELKSIHCLTSICRKKDSRFDRKKEMEAMEEEREFFWTYILFNE